LSERLGVRDVVADTGDLDTLTTPLRSAVVAFAEVLKAHAAVSNAHRGVIRAVLEQRLDELGFARGIDVAFGSGGRSHDDTDALRRMRHTTSRQLLDHLRTPNQSRAEGA